MSSADRQDEDPSEKFLQKFMTNEEEHLKRYKVGNFFLISSLNILSL